jgi:chlorobactene glucosyltransferase
MTTFLLLSTLAFLLALVITWWVHSRVGMDIVVEPAKCSPDSPLPFISVIVPARNEARNIRRCLEALLAQDYPRYAVIAVDDRSDDATPQILAQIQERHGEKSPPLKVIQGVDLPEGWAGKPHALHQGVKEADGEWFCFIDADTFARPNLLCSTYRTAQQHGADMFTMLTRQELVGFWERVIQPLVFTALSIGFPFERVNDPSKPDAIANGQFILIRKEAYQGAGGHAAVRERIDEDRALAAAVKGAGYRLLIANGWEVASTRMYTTFAEIWEGWTKNIYLGMQGKLGLLTFGAFVGLLGALVLPVWLLLGIFWILVGGGTAAWVVTLQALLAWAFLLYYRVRAADAFEIPRWYALTLPLGSLMMTAMMFASTYKVLSGQGVSWRGRTYKQEGRG